MMQEDRLADAIAHFRRAIETNPGAAEPYAAIRRAAGLHGRTVGEVALEAPGVDGRPPARTPARSSRASRQDGKDRLYRRGHRGGVLAGRLCPWMSTDSF